MTIFETAVFLLYVGVLFWIFACIAWAADYKAKRLEQTPQLIEDLRKVWGVETPGEQPDDADEWDRRKAIEESV